jgi:parallel beta-helix repeat protein
LAQRTSSLTPIVNNASLDVIASPDYWQIRVHYPPDPVAVETFVDAIGVEVMKYISKILTVLLFTLGAQAALADDITFIDQCGVSSSANNETLIVTSDIQGEGYCIEISHENVTLDCQGHVLLAQPGAFGIRILDEAHYVTVRNCIFVSWFFGISSNGGWGLIEHNEIIDGGFGMTFTGDGNEIRHNKIMGGGWVGMDFYSNSDNNLIHLNSVHDKPGGMFIRHSSSNDIFHNIIIGNRGIGILLDDESNSNNVIGNRTNHNGRTGILLRESYENLVADNVANKNAIGIEETGEELDNTYEDNVCKANETVDSNIDGACK